ncbi:MAG: FHA domain-containing protein [Chitinophagaceae bacterium]|nr:FHA domain-containing protein [Chitinophagaceae bacterium]
MLEFLKQKNDQQPMDVKIIRNKLLQFIKDQLQRREGGEGSNIRGIELYIASLPDERDVYESTVYFHDTDRFKNEEVQKIADDYAIDLPAQWNLTLIFVDELPVEAVKSKELPVALHIGTKKQPTLHTSTTAYLKVLSGEAEHRDYTIEAGMGRICIGRDREVQTADGFFRINKIAFLVKSATDSNKYISRQHAHIEWNEENGCFYLFADEGGIPPRNKVKVQTADGSLVKLQTIQIGHPLKEGDQIMLGESSLLQFTYGKNESDGLK